MNQSMTTQAIAQVMNLSVSAIYNHQKRMRAMVGVQTSTQLLTEAIKHGWIEVST